MVGSYGLFAVIAVALVAGVADAHAPSKIVGGTYAALGEFPYQVSLRVRGKHFCGGAIIGPKHIVTAAHCVTGVVTRPYNDLLIVTGTVKASQGQTHKVKLVLYHEHYGAPGSVSPNDISIVVLYNSIQFNQYQNQIGLASQPTPSSVSATVTGWGFRSAQVPVLSEDLFKTTVTTLTANDCVPYLARVSQIYTHQICAYGSPGTGVCQGDSGGPLVYNNQLIGVVSYNIPCGNGIPDVYSSIYHYRDWINSVVASY